MNFLKESISKLNSDFNKDRLFYQNMQKTTTKQSSRQFFPDNKFMKSYDGLASNNMLPSINGTTSKRLPVKSPVMESIRMSRHHGGKNFMSASRNRGISPDSCSSGSDKSAMSKHTHMHKNSNSKRNNPKNMSMNKGTFFVHKRDNTTKPAERHEHVIRASTILNSSIMFGNKLRNSKIMHTKKSFIMDKEVDVTASNNGLGGLKRRSKTFIDKDMFKNRLVSRQPEEGHIMNPLMESNNFKDLSYYEEDKRSNQFSQQTVTNMQGNILLQLHFYF
jgi:hypothetical protein